jgi:hypothetical protein
MRGTLALRSLAVASSARTPWTTGSEQCLVSAIGSLPIGEPLDDLAIGGLLAAPEPQEEPEDLRALARRRAHLVER